VLSTAVVVLTCDCEQVTLKQSVTPCITRKKRLSGLESVMRSDAADAASADHKAMPPPVIRRPKAAADHQFVGSQL